MELQHSEKEPEGFLSDESSFYGDSPTKLSFEEEIKLFDVAAWWKSNYVSPTAQADKSVAASILAEKSKVSVTLHNPYEGIWSGRQLSETIEEFLERVPPLTTPVTAETYWIWIANPFVHSTSPSSQAGEEAPAEPEADWEQYISLGESLLENFVKFKESIEVENQGKPMVIARAVGREREEVVTKLRDLAVELHCTTGKWLIFTSAEQVNFVWKVIARATAQGDLGIAAKVAPDEGSAGRPRVICVYTKNFTDIVDLGRVVRKMRDLGLVEARGRAIYYKCDAYTHLQLNNGNEYGIKASLYNSTEILKAKEQNVENFFGKRKRND